MMWQWKTVVGSTALVLIASAAASQPTGEIRVSRKSTALVWLLPDGKMAYSLTTDDDGFITFAVSTYRFVRR